MFSYLSECTEAEVNSLLPDLFLAIESCHWWCIILLTVSNCSEESGRTETQRGWRIWIIGNFGQYLYEKYSPVKPRAVGGFSQIQTHISPCLGSRAWRILAE